ncbi:hypothetical protein FA15DRAFT_317277 [Coprinopsis marcescibilis]|uniref:Uncharacterized protein n=1 Tax=Coprinopsis marcescibilis TaxID=230819 RepID=A0A5C3KCC1_COPMA|nr:hypothetical protein FA15DRAFT_317277 [Coprinopsis marcescibilis]
MLQNEVQDLVLWGEEFGGERAQWWGVNSVLVGNGGAAGDLDPSTFMLVSTVKPSLPGHSSSPSFRVTASQRAYHPHRQWRAGSLDIVSRLGQTRKSRATPRVIVTAALIELRLYPFVIGTAYDIDSAPIPCAVFESSI